MHTSLRTRLCIRHRRSLTRRPLRKPPPHLCPTDPSPSSTQANYSFSGALHTLSKLILCAVMIRGRHRGLPVALDRAVLLPHEFERREDGADEVQDPPAQEPNVMSEKRQQPDAASVAHEKDGIIEGSSSSHPLPPRTRTLSFADPPTVYGARLAGSHVNNSGLDVLPSHIHDIDETSPV